MISQAQASSLVERVGGEEYGFVHKRVRDALAGTPGTPAVQRRHAAVAMAIKARGATDAESVYALARHYSLGRADSDASAVYQANYAAGRRALDECAEEEARIFFGRARQAAVDAGLPLAPDLDIALGELHETIGRVREAAQYFESAIPGVESADARAELLRRVALARLWSGRAVAAEQVILRAFSELGVRLPDGAWGKELLEQGRLWSRRRSLPPGGSAREALITRCFLAATEIAHCRLDRTQFRSRANLATKHALASGDRSLIAATELYDDWVQAEVSGETPPVKPLELSDTTSKEAQFIVKMVRARLLERAGDTQEVESTLVEVLSLRESVAPYFERSVCAHLARNLLLRGYPERAWLWLERCIGDDPHDRERRTRIHPLDPYAASALATLGRHTEAQARLQAFSGSVAGTPKERERWVELLAHALAVHVELRTSEPNLVEIRERYAALEVDAEATHGGTARLGLRHYDVFCAHAHLAEARKDVKGAKAHLEIVIQRLEREPTTPLLRAHAAFCQGAMSALSDDIDEMERHLVRAEQFARRSDAPWVLGEAALLRAQTRSHTEWDARLAYEIACQTQRARHIKILEEELEIEPKSREAASMSVSINLQKHLAALLRVSLTSATVLDPREQARVALDEIVSLVGAERGFLFLMEESEDDLVMEAGRHASRSDIERAQDYSRIVLGRVRTAREPVIVNGAEDGEALGSQSAVHGMRSIIAAPLMLRDRLVGAVYLDKHLAQGVFGDADAEILLAIGNHIAIALETVRTAQVGTYARVAANVPGMVFQLLLEPGEGWSFKYVSDGCRDLFGFEPEAGLLDADTFFQRIHPDDREDLRRSLLTADKTNAPWRWEGRSVGGESEKWVQGAGRAERQGGGVILWDGLLMDISTRRHAEDTLERQAKELARSNRDLEQFAYAASHDLQEPLRVVASYLQLLRRRYHEQLDGDAREFITYAVDGANRMQGMIRALLKYSRVGTRPYEYGETNLNTVFGNACENLATSIAESRARVEATDLPTLHADEAQMVQLFQNLIGNAIKFRTERPVSVQVTSEPAADGWRISVIDNGIGIAEEERDRVFGLFQRLHTKAEVEGSGVGLTICQKIVERHSGSIGVEPTPGGGSTFWFELPAVQKGLDATRLSTAVTRSPKGPR